MSPWVFLKPMTCPMDPRKFHSYTVVLHQAMRVIRIETFGAKGESLELLHLSLNMLEILNLIQPDLQRKSGPRCLPLLMQFH